MKKSTFAVLTIVAGLVAGQAMAADATSTTPVAMEKTHKKATHKHVKHESKKDAKKDAAAK